MKKKLVIFAVSNTETDIQFTPEVSLIRMAEANNYFAAFLKIKILSKTYPEYSFTILKCFKYESR